MPSASSSALTRARAGAGLSLPLRRVRWTVEHAIQGLSWQGIAIVGGFSAIYGLNPRSGGVPELAEAARGMAAGMMLFVPAYVLAVVAAQFAPRQIVPRALVLTLVAVAGIAVGYALAATAFEGELSWRGSGAKHATMVLPVVLTVLLGLAILILHERERAAAQAVHDEMERKLDLERRMSEARLKALQSQIEPHFLFNSLAHVRRLCRTDAPAGRGMLRHLAHYIGAAQPALMHAGIPLADDADLAVAYLNIQQIRMGERLRFDVDLPRGARAVRVPPMTLTTLAENAIKHGLSPLEDGGEIRIAARAQGEAVVVDVADSGQGFQSTLGAGVGLANTRARLAMLHGAAASLELTMNSPRGVIATLVLPRESSSICAP